MDVGYHGNITLAELGSIPFYQFQIPFQFLFINSWVNSNSFGFKKSQFQFNATQEWDFLYT